jgi:hypothetical protein
VQDISRGMMALGLDLPTPPVHDQAPSSAGDHHLSGLEDHDSPLWEPVGPTSEYDRLLQVQTAFQTMRMEMEECPVSELSLQDAIVAFTSLSLEARSITSEPEWRAAHIDFVIRVQKEVDDVKLRLEIFQLRPQAKAGYWDTGMLASSYAHHNY